MEHWAWKTGTEWKVGAGQEVWQEALKVATW